MISVYLIVCFLAFLIELDFYFISNTTLYLILCVVNLINT